MEPTRFTGVVKWFSSKGEAYGYVHGFKHPSGESGEVFIHYANIGTEHQDNPKFRILKKGDKVSFEIGSGHSSVKSGTQAVKLILVRE